MRSTTITIHPDALAHNLQVIKNKLQPTTKVLAMVKANAYGHDIEATLPALSAADGFGVACMSEAMAVANALTVAKPIILIEGVFSQAEWQLAIEKDFGCVVHHNQQLNWALQNQPQATALCRTIWLKYNTGMSRLGFDDTTIIDAAKALSDAGYRLILTSHFACADDKTHPLNAVQIDKFNAALAQIRKFAPNTQASLCNSAGVFNFDTVHYDWVRAGIALYGSKPTAQHQASELGLKPAMTVSAQIMAIHELAKGQSVGYAALWTASNDCRIAVVSIGYGDGYPRVIADAHVGIIDKNNQLQHCPIVGRVAMDMLMVDISNIEAELGATVILWGTSPHIDEIAARAGTIGYELMCRLTTRPTRQIKTINESL
ncbi:alanine racemase [Moraxella cuniculi]|uniref:Alanine racemase n=1 Tax=Moraxella cuniculi TaxID=34061 RepID=A0A3S4QSZ8_9GAMM|nr:alanine racemase [Moraxella cuniculi]VEG13564.1 Alanine racemase, catabolic [Moraxella cuniculi]